MAVTGDAPALCLDACAYSTSWLQQRNASAQLAQLTFTVDPAETLQFAFKENLACSHSAQD